MFGGLSFPFYFSCHVDPGSSLFLKFTSLESFFFFFFWLLSLDETRGTTAEMAHGNQGEVEQKKNNPINFSLTLLHKHG